MKPSVSEPPCIIPEELKLLTWTALHATGWEDRVRQLSKSNPNWDLLLKLAYRHRMIPLLYHSVQKGYTDRPPDHLLEELARETRGQRAQYAQHCLDLERIIVAFEAEDIPVLVLKGFLLSGRLYKDDTLRQAKDIDLLIRPTDRKAACEILKKQGYQTLSPHPFSPAQEWYTDRFGRTMEFYHPVRGTGVDLMTRLHQQTCAPPASLFFAQGQDKSKSDVYQLPHFDEALDLLAHGGKHGWERHKWLTDLWQAFECYDIDWEIWQKTAINKGFEGALNSALLLHQWIVPEHPLPVALSREMQEVTTGRQLARWACSQIADLESTAETGSRSAFQGRQAKIVKMSAVSPEYRMHQVKSMFYSKEVLGMVELPKWAYWLYPPLEVARWSLRRFGMLANIQPEAEVAVPYIEKQQTKSSYGKRDTYLLFGLRVVSDVELPLERAKGEHVCDLAINLVNELPERESDQNWVLNIPATGTILVKDKHTILVKPAPGATGDNLLIWLLGSTMGFVCWQRDLIPLHATAVRFGSHTVMIAGPKGMGKSTLAAACMSIGGELVSDDLCPIHIDEGGMAILPGNGPRRLKLWYDAAERFAKVFPTRGVVEEGLKKLEISAPPARDIPVHTKILICIKDDPGSPEIQVLRGAEALRTLTENLFRSSFVPDEANARVLRAALMLSQHLNVIQIRRPEGHDAVAKLADMIASGWPAININTLKRKKDDKIYQE